MGAGGLMQVKRKWIYDQIDRDKMAGMANRIPGEVHYVLPGTSATHFAFAKSLHKNVYTDVNAAYTACTTGRGDAIVLYPGDHTLTAEITASKNNVSIWGPEAWCGQYVRKSSASITPLAATDGFAITGTDMAFNGVTCIPITAKNFATFTAAADRLQVRNCYIDLATPAVNISTKGFTGSAGIDDFLFKENIAWSDGAQGPAVTVSGLNNNALFQLNHYHVDAGTWAVAASLVSPDGIVVDRDLATCGGTAMTACYDGSGTTVIGGVLFKDCRKGVLVTLFVDGFGTTSHAELVGNHTATIGGGTGETLITAIT